MTRKSSRLIKIRNILVIIAVFSSCLTLIGTIVTSNNKNIQIGKIEQVETSKDEENAQESENIENSRNSENVEDIEKTENEEVIEFESIVQGFRDTDLPDGKYVIVVNDEKYTVELINYYDNVIYTENIELGDDTTEYKTLVVKYHKNLTINEGVTVTARTAKTVVDGQTYDLTYKKGMYLCVLGDLHNEGTITMTARGTYNCEGQNVYLWKNHDNSYEYVPANGAKGLVARRPFQNMNRPMEIRSKRQ